MEHFRILQKCTFDLKSGYWIFLENFSCMILSNTRLQLAEEKKRHLLEQVTGIASNWLDLSEVEFTHNVRILDVFCIFGQLGSQRNPARLGNFVPSWPGSGPAPYSKILNPSRVSV